MAKPENGIELKPDEHVIRESIDTPARGPMHTSIEGTGTVLSDEAAGLI